MEKRILCDGDRGESLLLDFVQGLCLLQRQRGQKKSPGVTKEDQPGEFCKA